MKRCPQCRRDYFDDSLLYCLDDGASLVLGTASIDLEPTEIFSLRRLGKDTPTLAFSGAETVPGRPGANTIAVLPLLNLSRDPESDYFSDGLSEELLNVLAKINGLRVAARTSAFSFKGKQATIAEIGHILNVASVLEGSVRKADDRIRVSVQLVKVVDGYQLWSETYDRTIDDIFAVQDDIAQSVVEEIRVRLLGEKPGEHVSRRVVSEIAKAVKGRTDDPEAQRLLMLGRYFLDRTTREDTNKAIEHFRAALDIDPDFALCWAELGRAYSIEAGRGWITVNEGFDKSREAVQRALSIEPDLAEGHAQLGRILAVHDWDLNGAEASYRRALDLAPGSSPVLDGASVLYYKLGRFDDAIRLGIRVLEQDPLSPAYWHNHGLTCHAAGLLDDSANAFRRALDLAPQRFVSRALSALVELDKGEAESALSEAEREPDEFWRTWALSIISWQSKRRKQADDFLQRLLAEHCEGNAYQIAEVYAMRSEADYAFGWLQKAVDNHDPGVTHTKVNPRFKPLHEDTRWESFLSKIGFESS